MPADVQHESGESESQFYAVPQRGQPPTFHWPNNSRLVADHVVAGAFESASRLLADQLGIVRMEPFKQLFLTTYARYDLERPARYSKIGPRSRAAYNAVPLSTPNFVYPFRNWQEATGKAGLPSVGLKLSDLAQRLQQCYQLTTQGKFSDAIVKLRQVILSVPLLVVDSKQEVISCTSHISQEKLLPGPRGATTYPDLPRVPRRLAAGDRAKGAPPRLGGER